MKIVLLTFFLLCGQLLFANFSPPASASHSLIYSQSIDNQLQTDFKSPLLPIEPAKPKTDSDGGSAGWLLLMAVILLGLIAGLVLFPIGFATGQIQLWSLALKIEIGISALLLLICVPALIIFAIDKDNLGAAMFGIPTAYILLIFAGLKGIELIILGLSMSLFWLGAIGLLLLVLAILLPIVLPVFH